MSENQDYTLILNQLEKLDAKIDGLASEVSKTNIEMAKLSGMKHALQDLKDWRTEVTMVVNPEDLRKMKDALGEMKYTTENMENVEKEIEALKNDKENDKEEINKLKTFNTKIVTIGSIIGFIFTTALVILGWYLS